MVHVNREQLERTRRGKLRKRVEEDNGIASARQRHGEAPVVTDVRIDGGRYGGHYARENRRDSGLIAGGKESRHRA